MIDEFVAPLKQEQVNNDGKTEYCNKELDSADDKKEVRLGDTAIVDAKGGVVITKAEIESLDVEAGLPKDSVAAAAAAVCTYSTVMCLLRFIFIMKTP